MDNYIINVSGNDVEASAEDLTEFDIVRLAESKFHIVQSNKTYHMQVIEDNDSNKELTIVINGNRHSISIKDGYDQMVKKMGLLITSHQKINEVKAPMPGLILDINVAPGQEIKKDDQLLVLSAMKMENIILAPGEGTVKNINVKTGDAVDKGQVIIEME